MRTVAKVGLAVALGGLVLWGLLASRGVFSNGNDP
jgi:hypothetical protein